MRVVSFQDRVVLEIILKDGVYFADAGKCREKHNYRSDRDNLGGKQPVWVFANPDISFNLLSSGELLERWRCEMSLDQETGLTQFVMLELEIPEGVLKTGKTHNAYPYAKVIDRINKESLCAVYRIEYTGHWYYKKIVPERFFVKNPCIPKTLDTRALKFYGLYDEETSDCVSESGCAYCESITTHHSGNLFLCSKYCEDRILRLCKKYFSDQNVCKTIFNEITFDDVRNMKMGRPLKPACTPEMNIF